MTSARRGLSFAGLLLLAVVIGRADDGPPSGESKMPREPDKAAAPDEKSVPTVTLTQKEYQDLLDRIKRLEGSAAAEPPSSCKVTGHVAGDLAQLTIFFDFQTGPKATRIALGCGQGYPTEVKIDGHPPQLKWGADGLSVLVDRDKAGDHQLVLKLDLPLATRERAAERGLDLDLPAAVTTTFDLDLPPGVKKALLRTTVRGEAVPAKPPPPVEIESPANQPSHLKSKGGLGPVERLEVTWEGQAPAAGATLLNVTASRVTVEMDDSLVSTSAVITVGVHRGQLKEVQLVVPPQAAVRGADGEDRIEGIAPASGPLRTVRLKQPTTEPLTLTVVVRQPRTGGRVPIGPFLVLGAFPQGGDLFVKAPADRTVDYHPRGESLYLLTRRDPGGPKRDPGDSLALHYSTRTHVDKAEALPPFLELEAEPLKTVFEAGVTHDLRMEGGAWRVTTTIEALPSQAEPGDLFIRLPEKYTFDESYGVQSSSGDVQVAEPLEAGKPLKLMLNRKRKSTSKVTLTFRGQYNAQEVPAKDRGETRVPLPVFEGKTLDRGAKVSVTLSGGLELIAPSRPGPFWDKGKAVSHNERVWTPDYWPEGVELAWRPYRPELIVNGEARVTLRGGQASVTQRLWLPPGQAVPEQLVLSVPRGVSNLTVAGEAEGAPRREVTDGTRVVQPAPPADRDHALVLRYSFALPERAADPIPVPLVRAATATGGETRVCVWSDPGTQPELKEGRWAVLRTEEVKDENSYPSLVLLSEKPDEPLTLGLGEAGGLALATFQVKRVLIQATVDGGEQKYRARFFLKEIAAPTIDVELPWPLFRPSPPDVTVRFGGEKAAWRPVDEAGRETAVSRIARVQVPADVAGKSAVLQIEYTLLPGRGVLQTQLLPPRLRGDPGAVKVRWQVVLPPSWVPLLQDTVGPEYGWGPRGWLLALRPTASAADLESWLVAPDAPGAEEVKPSGDTAVDVERSALEPLRLNYVPQQPWLLVCSLTLLIVGLSLAFLSLPRGLFWGTLAVIGVGALLAGLFWPAVLGAVLYGCQPGALVLLPVLGVQWLLHQRHRRQVVFLPGFTRLKAGSSLHRRGGDRPRGEPSTVDAATPPAAAESGSKKPQADGTAGA